MRLFISLNFDETFVSSLLHLQNVLKNSGFHGNFTKSENLHLTLAFIGEYGNAFDVLDVVDSVPFRQLRIKLDGFKIFRDMFFVTVADNPALSSYVRRLRRALSDAGIPFDRKNFTPHVTLIRKTDSDNLKKCNVSSFFPFETEINHVSLMKSERGKNGMIYTEILR